MVTSPPALSARHLRAAFELERLDGREAQRPFEPARRGRSPRARQDGPLRDGAALAYLFDRGGRLFLPLTVRRDDLPEHKGQVSLPGGRPADGEALRETALREAREEIGLDPPCLEHLGRLAPVTIPVTHSQLHVFVAHGPDPAPLCPDPREVAEIVEVTLDDLANPASRRWRRIEVGGVTIDVPFFDVGGLFLWGATAMALSELVTRLRLARDGGSEPPVPPAVS